MGPPEFTLFFAILIGLLMILISFISAPNHKSRRLYKYRNTSLILERYGDTSYASNGLPNGGLLLSMLSTETVCSNYKTRSKVCASSCDNLLDIGDVNEMLVRIRSTGANTNCFAIDTTYFRSDLPNYLFGPYPGTPPTDFVIGIFVDIRKVMDFIACMFPIDSGSVGRYGTVSACPTIDPSEWQGGKTTWNNYLKSQKSKNLALAGCGKMNEGLGEPANSFILNTDDKATAHTNKLQTYNSLSATTQYWAFDPDGNVPYSKYQWRQWVDAVKHVYSIADNAAFVEKQLVQDDGYRENEVDIIVPNDATNSECNTCTKTNCVSCAVTTEFQKVWRDALLGVFTISSTNCTNSPGMQSNAELAAFACTDTEDSTCCCSDEFSEMVVKDLVSTFNDKYGKNIGAYKLRNVVNISNFTWVEGASHWIDLEEL